MKQIIFFLSFLILTIQDCKQQCAGNSNYNECLAQCEAQLVFIGVMVGGIVGGILLTALILYIIVLCIRSTYCEYLRQCNRRNNVVVTRMTEQQFYLQRKYFQSLLKDTLQRQTFQTNTNKGIKTKSEWEVIEIVDYRIRNQKLFISKLQFLAQDHRGQWKGQGFYFVGKETIEVWWIMYYTYCEDNVQLKHQHVLFEGKMSREKVYEGDWYFNGFENDFQYAGKWGIFKRGTKLNHTTNTSLHDLNI